MTRTTEVAACLAFLEAAYAWEKDDGSWVRGLVEAARAVWGRCPFAYGFLYDTTGPERFELTAPLFLGENPAGGQAIFERTAWREKVAQLYRTNPVGFARPVGGVDDGDLELLSSLDAAELFVVNGLDGGGRGCALGIGAPRTTMGAAKLGMFQRLAAHLGSAYRCRSRLRAGAPDALASSEAVLSPDGTLLEARGPAEAPASRRTLGEAARTIAQVRRQRRSSIEPTGRWFPRVSGRWTLVDTYAQSGQRYIVARENQCHPVGLEGLTEREQQVVVSAASGKTNKEVAYELGISHSTARVLLSRACARLGVRTRAELFALPGVRTLRGLPADD